MDTKYLDIQGDWDAQPLRDVWPTTPDWTFFMDRVAIVTEIAAIEGAAGRALEVAAADGTHACHLAARGLKTFILEPSPVMLEKARLRMARRGVRLTLVRGIAETLPFRDAAFDRVLCDSAIDHFRDPETGIREMARITKPDGRLLLSFVNYRGVAARFSRLVYTIGRALRLMPPSARRSQWWDSPVPLEHTFEASVREVRAMCAPYLELDRAWGISIGAGCPGWGRLLERCSWLLPALGRIDTFARNHPRAADFVVTVWRPRVRERWPVDEYRVRPTNPVYRREVRAERAYWEVADFGRFFNDAARVMTPAANRALTGDPARSWVADAALRGPFRHAAFLGCDDPAYEVEWLRSGHSERVDLYDLNARRLERTRQRLGPLASRLRAVCEDLNFVCLPRQAYDVIVTSNTLTYVTNLEHLLTQIARALRPDGLLVVHEWVGERRKRYGAERLARANAILEEVPARFRRAPRAERPDAVALSPFCAVRSDEILPVVHRLFETVSETLTGRLYPLALLLDVPALEREAPDVLAGVLSAEASVRDDPTLQPGVVYGIYRPRAG